MNWKGWCTLLFNPSTSEMEPGKSLPVQDQLGLQREFQKVKPRGGRSEARLHRESLSQKSKNKQTTVKQRNLRMRRRFLSPQSCKALNMKFLSLQYTCLERTTLHTWLSVYSFTFKTQC